MGTQYLVSHLELRHDVHGSAAKPTFRVSMAIASGLGRIYVQLENDEPLNYDNWVAGLKDGRSYCGDGLSHIVNFECRRIGCRSRVRIIESEPSRLDIATPSTVRVKFDAAALLEPEPTDADTSDPQSPSRPKTVLAYRAMSDRRERNVPIEVIVNGEVAATRNDACRRIDPLFRYPHQDRRVILGRRANPTVGSYQSHFCPRRWTSPFERTRKVQNGASMQWRHAGTPRNR